MDYLREMQVRRVVTLRELQVLAGRMQRAILTMPPRSSVYLANVLAMMSGLKLPWHRRRMTAGARADIDMLIRVLEANMGRGYFDVSHFE